MHSARSPYLKPVRGIQLNRSHPLARGLVGCWLFNEGTGTKVHDLSGNGAFGNVSVWSWAPDGLREIADSNQRIALPASYDPLGGKTGFTILSRVKPADVDNDSGIFYTQGHFTSHAIAYWLDSNDIIQIVVNTSGGGGLVRSGSISLVADTWYTLCLTWDGATVRLYVNETEDIGDDFPLAINGTLDTTSSNGYTWGGDENLSKEFRGTYNFGMLWDRGITSDEYMQLYSDPYAMFEQNRARWFSVAGGIAVFASISDGVGVSDTIATITGHSRIIADSLSISDVLTRIATYIRSLAVNLATTDTINTARNLKRSMAENVGVTDTVTTKKFVLVALADNLGITDVITRIVTFFRSIPDTLDISDTLTTIRTILRSISDGVGITDVLTSEKFILVAIADTVGITDTIATIGTFIRGIADGIGITDVISRIGTFIRSESDNVSVTDTVIASKGVSRTITDDVGLTDVIAAVLGKVSSIADSVGITDVLTFIRTTVVGGRVFIAGIAKSLRISGRNKSLTVSGEDKSLKISGSGD